ncbi:hypothetical protein OSB04_029320 [Centaurea solstitialis]|uniref:Uncharacterized protein n=1 Tax=Centaurea solstitialis TaxID=347529 RepID=A0AA38SJ12_9ASTR|nr:hypothetical protein OSB04_029320 [Centaurea solstitialis]
MEPKIEIALVVRNLEAKAYSRGRIEEAAIIDKRSLELRLDGLASSIRAERNQEVENVHKEYAVETFEVEFWVNLISSFMKEINMMIDTDWLSWD